MRQQQHGWMGGRVVLTRLFSPASLPLSHTLAKLRGSGWHGSVGRNGGGGVGRTGEMYSFASLPLSQSFYSALRTSRPPTRRRRRGGRGRHRFVVTAATIASLYRRGI